jgi:hypothetical protein
MSYELPKGFEIPPNGDFETLDQLQDLPGTTIRHELETSDGLRWEFRESHETLLPEAEEDLDGLVDREMEPRLNRPKLPEGVREVIRLLLLSAERPSDLGYRYRWFCRLLQSLDRVASRSGAQ